MLKKEIEYPLLFIIPDNILLKKSKIHSLFMKINIDVLFIDENSIIYDKTFLKPFNFYSPAKEAKYILEIEENFTKKNQIKIGNKIKIN